jgi:hypothetical protein
MLYANRGKKKTQIPGFPANKKNQMNAETRPGAVSSHRDRRAGAAPSFRPARSPREDFKIQAPNGSFSSPTRPARPMRRLWRERACAVRSGALGPAPTIKSRPLSRALARSLSPHHSPVAPTLAHLLPPPGRPAPFPEVMRRPKSRCSRWIAALLPFAVARFRLVGAD